MSKTAQYNLNYMPQLKTDSLKMHAIVTSDKYLARRSKNNVQVSCRTALRRIGKVFIRGFLILMSSILEDLVLLIFLKRPSYQ